MDATVEMHRMEPINGAKPRHCGPILVSIRLYSEFTISSAITCRLPMPRFFSPCVKKMHRAMTRNMDTQVNTRVSVTG